MLQVKVSAPQVPRGRLKLPQMSLAHLLLSKRAPANSAKMRQVTMDTARVFRTSYKPLMFWLCCPSFFQSCFWAFCPLLRDSGLCDQPHLKVHWRRQSGLGNDRPARIASAAVQKRQLESNTALLYPCPTSDAPIAMSESWN